MLKKLLGKLWDITCLALIFLCVYFSDGWVGVFLALLLCVVLSVLWWFFRPRLIRTLERTTTILMENERLTEPSELFHNIMEKYHLENYLTYCEVYKEIAKDYPPNRKQERQVMGIIDRGFMRQEDSRQLVENNMFGYLFFNKLIELGVFDEPSW